MFTNNQSYLNEPIIITIIASIGSLLITGICYLVSNNENLKKENENLKAENEKLKNKIIEILEKYTHIIQEYRNEIKDLMNDRDELLKMNQILKTEDKIQIEYYLFGLIKRIKGNDKSLQYS